MHDDIKAVLFTEEQIKARVKELADEITRDYPDGELLTVCILKGAVVFYADLLREISRPARMDFMVLSSYGASSVSTGVVRILYDLEQDISGKHVLIIEDIVDTGLTLHYLTKALASRNPKSLKVCCMFDKPSRRKAEFAPDYVGYKVSDVFIVGYGLDYSEKYRNLKYVGELKSEIYT